MEKEEKKKLQRHVDDKSSALLILVRIEWLFFLNITYWLINHIYIYIDLTLPYLFINLIKCLNVYERERIIVWNIRTEWERRVNKHERKIKNKTKN